MAQYPKITMPSKHVKADAEWIQSQLMKLRPEDRATAARGYTANFVTAWREESIEHKRENRARYRANTSLRQYVDDMIAWYNSQQYEASGAQEVTDSFEW